MNIFIDIETLPDMREGARTEYIEAAVKDVKVPSGYTKEMMARDLGITDKDTIKFTARDSLAQQWCDVVGPSKATEIGDAAWRKTSFDGSRGQILMIGVALDDGPEMVITGPERDILSELNVFLEDAFIKGNMSLPTFVGHNLLAFDLPFIYHRSVILGVKPHATLPIAPSRYSDRVFDTMTQWAGWGGRISLDDLCKALGVPGKDGMDGSQVYDAWADGRMAELVDYCKADVTMTREVWRRMTFQEAA